MAEIIVKYSGWDVIFFQKNELLYSGIKKADFFTSEWSFLDVKNTKIGSIKYTGNWFGSTREYTFTLKKSEAEYYSYKFTFYCKNSIYFNGVINNHNYLIVRHQGVISFSIYKDNVQIGSIQSGKFDPNQSSFCVMKLNTDCDISLICIILNIVFAALFSDNESTGYDLGYFGPEFKKIDTGWKPYQ